MAGAAAHISRHPLDGGGELISIADEEGGVDRLVAAEQRVARGFAAHCGWPHRRVNLFVFETLQPLIERLQRASRTLGEGEDAAAASVHSLHDKPMVHLYNLADLSECSIFVNRTLMIRLGMWDDCRVIEGLLAHEHAHPLAENATTRAARRMKVTIEEAPSEDRTARLPGGEPVVQALQHLAHELCLHAPQEVFANELTVRAGFGGALLALNRVSLTEGRAGLTARAALAAHMQGEVAHGRLSENGAALLLLLASFEAHLRVALETAAFARAGHLDDAQDLEALLWREALGDVEPEVGSIYRQLYISYLALQPDMSDSLVREWAAATFAPIINAIARYGAHFGASFHF
ncbi:MAG: hypothetical protein WBP94_19480 [Rhodomicrobiaceae bacterium]